ncbi:prepilin-type N-terminal cleavage/methylation domain-containing protein [Microcoleus sp. FACHB-672]|uniref:prepilin-type N-terminal cleavage/methylation domain-containing protein n=1 Tax=Microcoleus sp. FACHB-672 TaxID=2692825 RepID=UPI0016850B3A|nr:prepilin-type N-terminal cleavage/methylation domain-containing protein [Microcoleus sp. FACHB-672]MBD2040592.1 prepilin-type N-terminal cleavage/methylation domain-containing protein [Microcoleus sp. FACHB-672]
MLKKNFKHTFRRQHKSAGFTLIELLVAVAMGWIVISALLYFVVQLSRTEQQELAMSETQRDMSVAVDYIGSDLKDAVFVYDGQCLITGQTAQGEQCPGLIGRITSFPDNDDDKRPILAFWKLETVPYVNNPEPAQQLPGLQSNGDCQGVAANRQTECKNLQISRSSYTLVIYFLRKTPSSGGVWDGPAQITRYALRQYDPDELSTLKLQDPNFTPPSTGGYKIWPCATASCSPAPAQTTFRAANEDVLVDLVDDPQAGKTPTCRLEGEQATLYKDLRYQPSYPEADLDKITSFYACVSPWKAGQGQEVKLYLRGNAFKRAGASGYNNTGFLPTVQAQVKTRSTFDRQPTSLY